MKKECGIRFKDSEKGMALVLTLMVLVLITAMVVEFSYGVYTTTAALHNWETSQRLSFIARSGVNIAVNILTNPLTPRSELFRYLEKEIPAQNAFEGFEGTITIKAEDENGKFNLNSVVWANGQKNAYDSFKRLLDSLGIEEDFADRIADWIDADSDPRLPDSEKGAKNGYFDSRDELLLIQGMDRATYEKLAPYVTVYGYDNPYSGAVNINTAPVPVIMSLDGGMTRELAERIVDYRKIEPFKLPGDLVKAGIERDLVSSISGKITTEFPRNFSITAAAEDGKIKRIIECVIAFDSGQIKYWKEM